MWIGRISRLINLLFGMDSLCKSWVFVCGIARRMLWRMWNDRLVWFGRAEKCGIWVWLYTGFSWFVWTVCTHFLYIELLPYFSHLLSHNIVEFNCFFDFLYRMNGGGMILASEFLGDLGKTQVQF